MFGKATEEKNYTKGTFISTSEFSFFFQQNKYYIIMSFAHWGRAC